MRQRERAGCGEGQRIEVEWVAVGIGWVAEEVFRQEAREVDDAFALACSKIEHGERGADPEHDEELVSPGANLMEVCKDGIIDKRI